MAATRNALVSLFWKVHPRLYRWSGGRIGGHLMNLPVLLLETVGRRSGRQRTCALLTLPWEDRYVVIASVLGEDHHPAWWLNLRDRAEATIRIGRERIAVSAEEARGEDRDRIWRALVARCPDYEEYAQRTTRRIPVVVLTPRVSRAERQGA